MKNSLKVVFSILLAAVLLPVTAAFVPSGQAQAAGIYSACDSGDTVQEWVFGLNSIQGQTFTAASNCLVTSVKLKLWRAGSPGDVTVSLRATDGSGLPTGDDLATHSFDGNSLLATSPGDWRDIVFDAPYHITQGVKYAIVVAATSADGSTKTLYWWEAADSYSGGNRATFNGATWSANTAWDMMFQVIGEADRVCENYQASDPGLLLIYGSTLAAQTFTTTQNRLVHGVMLPLYRYGLPGSITVSLRGTASGHPNGGDLVSAVINGNGLSTDYSSGWTYVIFNQPCWLNGNTKYAIVAAGGVNDTNCLEWLYKDPGGYAGGNQEGYYGTPTPSWHSETKDLSFEIMGKTARPGYAWNGPRDNFTDYADTDWLAQTYYANLNSTVTSVKLKLYRYGNPGTVTVSIKATDNNTASGKPAGPDLASFTINSSVLTTDAAGEWREFFFTPPVEMHRFGKYAIVLRVSAGGASDWVGWRCQNPGAFSSVDGYTSTDGSTWVLDGAKDFLFETWGLDLPSASIFRTADGADKGKWYLDYDRSGTFVPSSTDKVLGPMGTTSGDKPVSIDWDGDGKQSICVFRTTGANTGYWYIDTNNSGKFQPGIDTQLGPFGTTAGDMPVAIDWDGDGRQELCIFRTTGPNTGKWYIDLNHNGVFDLATDPLLGPFGTTAGDIPVAIDWDGDGRQELCIFRTTGPNAGKWYIDLNRNGVFDPASDPCLGPFGTTAGDMPVALDWDGDGRQELAIFRTTGPNTGRWYIDSNRNGAFQLGIDVQLGPFGSTAGDLPIGIIWEPGGD